MRGNNGNFEPFFALGALACSLLGLQPQNNHRKKHFVLCYLIAAIVPLCARCIERCGWLANSVIMCQHISSCTRVLSVSCYCGCYCWCFVAFSSSSFRVVVEYIYLVRPCLIYALHRPVTSPSNIVCICLPVHSRLQYLFFCAKTIERHETQHNHFS